MTQQQVRPASSAPLPAEIESFAAAENLGRHIASFEPRRAGTGRLIGLFVMGIVSLIIIVGFQFLWFAFRTPNLNKKLATRRIYVFDNGFVYVDHTGPVSVYRWDQISAVFQEIVDRYANGIKVATTYLYTVNRRDGATIKLTQFYADIATLGEMLCHYVARTQLPAHDAALAGGQSLSFGDITMNAAGVATKRSPILWSDIDSIEVKRGIVSLRRAGKWLPLSRTAARDIPNLYLFLHLAEKYRHAAHNR